MKELKEQFAVVTERSGFGGPEGVDTVQFWLQKVDIVQFWLQKVDIVQFWLQKEAVKWRIDADTWRVWLVNWFTEKDCCNKEAPVLDWIQKFYVKPL
jgi:hypothetical protein